MADAVRVGGPKRGFTPTALVSFLTAAAFAPLLVPLVGGAGAGEVGVALAQLGGVGGGYLAGVLSDVIRRADRDDPAKAGQPPGDRIRAELAEAIRQGLDAPGETGTGLRGEVSAVLRKVDAIQVALAADRDSVLATGFAELGEQVVGFRWVLGDLAIELAKVQHTLAAQGASQRSHMLAARGELDVITGLLQRVVVAQEAQQRRAEGQADEAGAPDGQRAGGGRDVCPYPGLHPFESRDARWFFGREELTAHVIDRLAEQRHSGAPLFVIGPSGAGKSSLLQAGVIPGLRDGLLPVPGSRRWPRVLVGRPGSRPLVALANAAVARTSGLAEDALRAELDEEPGTAAAALADRLLAGKAADRLVLVVDQFEDLFTECQDQAERLQFIRVLLALAGPPGGLVVLGARADFYEEYAAVAELRDLLPDNQLVVGPLDVAGLHRAITRPAAAAGLALEAGLTELMLTDLGLRAGGEESYQPGALPLLGYALQATWEKKAGRLLTVAGYRDAGGIHGAIASKAERIYADFPTATREVTHRIMLRMVSVGSGSQETRRAVAPAELTARLDPVAARAVVTRFTQARLITADQDGVEIAHEAFLRAWPRLREWIAEGRAGLRLHGQIRDDARAWADMERDTGSLYRGVRLANARSWRAAGDNEAEMTGLEREFLDASAAEEDARQAAEERLRLLERRQNRRLRALSRGMAVALAAAVAVTAVAVAVLNGRNAVRERQLELAGQFAAESESAVTTNLRTADLDALAGWQAYHTSTSLSSLLSSQANPYMWALPGLRYEPLDLAISPNSRLLAVGGPSAGGSGVQVWDLAAHRLVANFTGGGPYPQAVAFSPDGSTLVASIGSGHDTTSLRFWDTSTRRTLPDPVRLPGLVLTLALAYSPNGRILALGGDVLANGPDGPRLYPGIDVWDLAKHRLLRQLISTAPAPFWSLAFSPNGRLLASGGQDGAVRVWNVATGRQLAVLASPAPVFRVLFSPDGRYLAGSSKNGTVQAWTVSGSASFVLAERITSNVALSPPIAFSTEGHYLYTTVGTDDVDRYDLLTANLAGPPMRLQSDVFQMLASPDGKTLVLATLSPNHVFLLDTGGQTFYQPDDNPLSAVAVSPGGRLTATGAEDGAVQTWPTDDPAAVRVLSPGPAGAVLQVAFSPDGRLIAAGYGNCSARLWKVTNAAQAATLPSPPGVTTSGISSISTSVFRIAFSPNGKTLAAYCSNFSGRDTVVLWDTATWRPIAAYTVPGGGTAGGLAYSPHGHVLAIDTGTGTVQFWDTRSHRVVGSIGTGQGAGPVSVAFSPNGTLLATAGADDRIQLWDVATRKMITETPQNSSEFKDPVFSPNGSVLAAASQDSVVRMWQVPSLQPETDLTPPTLPVTVDGAPVSVNAVAFGYRGQTLVSASDDGTAQVWDLSPAGEVGKLCDALSGPGFAAEWDQLSHNIGPDPCRADAPG